MSNAEFEEREFETALYQQLRVGNNQVWSPGQFFQRIEEINLAVESFSFPRYEKMIRSYLIVLAFADTYRLQWFVLGATT